MFRGFESHTLLHTWIVDRVAYCISLLKRSRLKATTGSNPVLSSSALVLNYGLVSPTGLLKGVPVRIGFTYGYGVM